MGKMPLDVPKWPCQLSHLLPAHICRYLINHCLPLHIPTQPLPQVTVAKRMEEAGLKIPLLIGGATTSKMHTAVKIEPQYSGPVVYVLDASRSVPVVQSLLDAKQKDDFIADVRQVASS
jgi:hypothetical protein